MTSDDTFATSRAIDALKDPNFQAFAEALVDRVSAIVGNHQLRVVDGQAELNKTLDDIRYQLAESNRGREANAQTVAEFLARQGKQLDAVGKKVEAVNVGQAVLRAEFQATGESLSQWRAEVDATFADFRATREESINDRRDLRRDLDESNDDRRAIRAEQTERDAAVTVQLSELAAAVENLRVQHDALAAGINGRLGQLITAAESVARAEGRDQERAEHDARGGN